MTLSELLASLYWREALLLYLLALPLALILLNQLQQQRQWQKLAPKHLLPWLQINNKHTSSTLPLIFLGFAWCFLVIALSGPRLVDWVPPEQQAKPATLVIVIDLSASMNATDTYPSRQTQALQWLKQVTKNKPKHLKIGLVLFAGHAFTLMPATVDQAVITHFIEQLNGLKLPTLGNDLSAALSVAKQQFKTDDIEQHILVLTDGDLSKAEQTRAEITVNNSPHQSFNFIGFGGSKAVNIPNDDGSYLLQNGRPVQSRTQTVWLKQIGAKPRSTYQHYQQIKRFTLKQVIQLKQPRLSLSAQQHVLWNELFSYPLILALCLFIASLWQANKHVPHIIISVFFAALLLSHSPSSHAANHSLFKQAHFDQANAALNHQQYQSAQHLFAQIDSDEASFGEGIACFRQAKYHCATRAFSKAAWQTNKPTLQASAVFNLGNSYFFLGQYEQASVLFEDARNLGFNKQKALKNLQFSNAMQQAVLQQIKDIKKIFRRAKWRAAIAGEQTPNLQDIVSTQNNLLRPQHKKSPQFMLRQNINQQVSLALGINDKNVNGTTQWIKTEQVASQSTSYLLKRLFEMELAIPAPLKKPQTIAGKRSW